ncbi:MAG: hypothetical protein OXC82_05380 [Rhodobacteraceae bacterium]|nr:hypothetical protein [Paracoccaceae bacterium]
MTILDCRDRVFSMRSKIAVIREDIPALPPIFTLFAPNRWWFRGQFGWDRTLPMVLHGHNDAFTAMGGKREGHRHVITGPVETRDQPLEQWTFLASSAYPPLTKAQGRFIAEPSIARIQCPFQMGLPPCPGMIP